METRLLLADEPTGNLDVANGENVLAMGYITFSATVNRGKRRKF